MSMSIILEDEMHDPEYIEYLRQAVAEAEADNEPPLEWNLQEIKQRLHSDWAKKQGTPCHT
ncbi:MAG: hypothetical protein HQL94_05680 [Magnetococcales bacterium]|nr:hypothetical protein [Magnetococcales bacterium]MBF0437855.1 hypothetical protein [Magnetococcales bacterium]